MKRAKRRRFRAPEPEWFFLRQEISLEELIGMYPSKEAREAEANLMIRHGHLVMFNGVRIIGPKEIFISLDE